MTLTLGRLWINTGWTRRTTDPYTLGASFSWTRGRGNHQILTNYVLFIRIELCWVSWLGHLVWQVEEPVTG